MNKPKPPKKDGPEALLAEAFDALDEGSFETALNLAEKALKKAPGDRDAWLLKATCLDAVGDAEAAMAEFEGLTEAFPDDAEIWVRLADLAHHGLGDVDMALEALETALEACEPESESDSGDEEMAFEAHLRFVDAYLDVGDLEAALRHAEVAHSMDKDSPDAEVARGQVLFEMGKMDDAEKAAARAVDKDGKHAGAYFLRALVLERKGDIAGAKKAMERACTLEPETFSEGVTRSETELKALYSKALEEVPGEVQDFYKGMEVQVLDLPADSDLPVAGGHMSPSARVGLKGAPLSDVKPGDKPEKPDAVVIYRRNATRGCTDDDEILEVLSQALFLEAAEFLDLDDSALDEMLPDA